MSASSSKFEGQHHLIDNVSLQFCISFLPFFLPSLSLSSSFYDFPLLPSPSLSLCLPFIHPSLFHPPSFLYHPLPFSHSFSLTPSLSLDLSFSLLSHSIFPSHSLSLTQSFILTPSLSLDLSLSLLPSLSFPLSPSLSLHCDVVSSSVGSSPPTEHSSCTLVLLRRLKTGSKY